MKRHLILVNMLLAAAGAFAGDTAAQAGRVKNAPFEPRLTTLRGGSLQPAAGLQTASGLQTSTGIRQDGEGATVSGLSSEEEWRRVFPKKYGAR